MPEFRDEQAVMKRAFELALRGEGFVEPNPCVGAVIVDSSLRLLGEGFHERFGGPHAEVMALQQAGKRAAGATLFVTLEPCSHFGKTPPCVDAVIAAGIRRVVIAVPDPADHQAGSGIDRLINEQIEVEVGLFREQGESLLAPFTMLMKERRPFVHAKWAMTLDGKIATRTGESKWISNDWSRQVVHQLRGRMDGILVGIGTALADDPVLTARPIGPRQALRIVIDPHARLPVSSQLTLTAGDSPVLMVTTKQADSEKIKRLEAAGVQNFCCPTEGENGDLLLSVFLKELGRRNVTNLLVEGGSRVLGSFQDHGLIDEVHCFIAPKLVGGGQAVTPVGGKGGEEMPELGSLTNPEFRILDDNVYIRGRIRRERHGAGLVGRF